MTLTLRYMQQRDIPEVVAIDKASFNPPWPARSYAYEINESTYSYMAVLELTETQPLVGLRRMWRSVVGGEPQEIRHVIVGYGGLWKIADEAHISTIASHPEFRGHGYGEVVLAGMFGRALSLDAEYIVLEVRVSNTTAQRLYSKYEFKTIGVKRNYYRSDNEDAYDMRVELTAADLKLRFRQRYEKLRERLNFIDQYTDVSHPNLS